MNTDTYRAFVGLCDEEKSLKLQLADIKERKRTLTEGILAGFAEDGIDQMKIDANGSSHTIFPHETMRARPANSHEELNRAVKDAGFPELGQERVNAQTLGAFVREQLAEDTLPKAVRDQLDIYTDLTVRVRSAVKSDSATSRAIKNL